MSNTLTVNASDLLHQLKLSCQIPTLVEDILKHKIIVSTTDEIGIQAEPEELQKAADRLRLLSGLHTADLTWQWLQKHNLSLDDFEDLVHINVLSTKLAQHLFADKVDVFLSSIS